MQYLKGSIFDKDSMQTKVKKVSVDGKERFLGHILGPGITWTFYLLVTALRELYYMDVIRINEVYNNVYTYLVMTTVTSILGIATGFFINHLTEKTVCKAGRFRPYVLIGSWLMAIAGVCMFWSPFTAGTVPYLVWLYVFNCLYTCVGLPMFLLRYEVCSVISRNVLVRNNLTTIRSAVGNMIGGVLVSLGVTGMLYPMVLQKDLTGKSWIITILVMAGASAIFAVVEYFWTRERVTEENQRVLESQTGDASISVPLKQQMKNLLSNRYFVMSVIVLIGMKFYDSLQGGNVRVNMITYIPGGNDKNGLQMLYLMASMQPMAFGAVIVPILARKFSARKIMQVSAVVTVAGVGIAMIDPYNFGIAVAGGFVFACGIFAVTNMYRIFSQQAGDMIEYDHGYRPEGTLAFGIITTIYTTIMTPMSAIYETGLSLCGYQAGLESQPQAVNNWILFAYYGSYVIFTVIVFVVCIFFDAEKKMPQIHAALQDRARNAAEARGEVYYTPEEMEHMEKEAAAQELEQHRIADLKEICAKKGLDFDTENEKYLTKLAQKQAKKAAKKKK